MTMQTTGINANPQSYFPPNNPMFQYPQVQPTYVPPRTTYQAPMQQVQYPVGISGRMVNDPSEISPQDVSMDGTVSFFPTSDGQHIYAKSWNSDGTINTVEFTPLAEATEVDVPSGTEASDILDALASINDRLDKIEKQVSYRKKPYNGQRKPQHREETHDES